MPFHPFRYVFVPLGLSSCSPGGLRRRIGLMQPLQAAQLGAAAAGIVLQLLRRRRGGPPQHQAGRGVRPHTHWGKIRRTNTSLAIGGETLFHHPILQRMEGDNCQPSAITQAAEGGIQRGGQAIQFPVDRDAQGLKHTAGGMPVPSGAVSTASRITSASKPVVRRGSFSRALTTARAMRREYFSSPYR